MVVKGSRRALRTALIDLDDTLYRIPAITTGVRERIEEYMVEKLGIVREKVERACRELYVSHGTTLAGLVAQGYEIDYDDWHAQVHGTIPYRQHLKPDPRLRELLFSLEMPKYVFTNADRKHAEVCLGLLGVSDCFQGLICFESLQDQIHAVAGSPSSQLPVLCKPERKAFEMALLAAGNAEPHSTLFVDDSLRNVETATSMGITSVLVGSRGRIPQAEHSIPDIFSLPAVMPGLFDMPGDVMVNPSPAVPEPASLVLEESETVAV